MNKLTKGAVAMVLVGAVTFSAANFLLADHSKLSALANAVTKTVGLKTPDGTHRADKRLKNPTQKTADGVIPAEKTEKDQTVDIKHSQTTNSYNNSAIEDVSYNENDSNKSLAMIQQSNAMSATIATNTAAPATHTKINSNPAATATTSTKSAATAVPLAPTSKTARTSTTSMTANHGNQVSQAANEKAVSHQKMKVNNGINGIKSTKTRY